MVIKIDKKTVIKMIEKYYKEQMDLEGKASASPEVSYQGYGTNEYEVCTVFFKIRGKMKLLGDVVNVVLDVSDDDVENALKYCVTQEGYEFDSYEIISGVSSCSAIDVEPYFMGAEIRINGNTKKIGGK